MAQLQEVRHNTVHWHLGALPGGSVLDLGDTRRETPPHHQDGRHADQLGVGELHPRGGRPVIEDHPQAGRVQLGSQSLGGGGDRGVLARDHHVHVGRRYLTGPDQPVRVVALLGDRSDQPGDSDAVAPHGDPDRLAVGA